MAMGKSRALWVMKRGEEARGRAAGVRTRNKNPMRPGPAMEKNWSKRNGPWSMRLVRGGWVSRSSPSWKGRAQPSSEIGVMTDETRPLDSLSEASSGAPSLAIVLSLRAESPCSLDVAGRSVDAPELETEFGAHWLEAFAARLASYSGGKNEVSCKSHTDFTKWVPCGILHFSRATTTSRGKQRQDSGNPGLYEQVFRRRSSQFAVLHAR